MEMDLGNNVLRQPNWTYEGTLADFKIFTDKEEKNAFNITSDY